MRKNITRLLAVKLFFVLIVLGLDIVKADVDKILSLQDAIDLALVQNPLIEVSRLQRVVDKFSLRLAYNNFAPQFSLDSNIYNSKDNENIYSLTPKTTLKTKSGLELQANINVSDQMGTINNKTSLVATLPLMRGSGSIINTISLDNSIDQEEINRLNYRDSVARVINQVQTQYLKVLSDHKQLDALYLSLKRSKDTLHEYRLKVAAGDMPAANIAQQEAQITNDKIQLESKSLEKQSNFNDLLTMLGLQPTDSLTIDVFFEPQVDSIPDLQDAIAQAKRGNYDFQQNLISLRSKKRTLLQSNDDKRVKLDLSGEITADGNKSVNLTASIPINDLSLDYNVVSAKVSLKQAEINLKKAENDLIATTTNFVRSLNTQKKQIDLAVLNLKYAKQNYENALESNLYGKTSAYEVVAQMQKYLQSEMALINYRIEYYSNYAEFNMFLGLTLDKWQVKLAM
ncbi:MAG: TolC family protein [Pseudomonadota bacterium]|nr:TolC family protein [Pseudomonadota bacterium]